MLMNGMVIPPFFECSWCVFQPRYYYLPEANKTSPACLKQSCRCQPKSRGGADKCGLKVSRTRPTLIHSSGTAVSRRSMFMLASSRIHVLGYQCRRGWKLLLHQERIPYEPPWLCSPYVQGTRKLVSESAFDASVSIVLEWELAADPESASDT